MYCCTGRQSDKHIRNTTEELLCAKRKLEIENKQLREQLKSAKDEWSHNVDEFVEKWFDENQDHVDIGVINVGFFKIDLFPDYIEKHIYKKVIKILYSFITSAIAPKVTS